MKPYCKVVPNKDILFSELFIIMSDFRDKIVILFICDIIITLIA